MPYSFPPDLQQFVDERLASGQYSDADDLLRAAFRVLSEEEQEFVAVRDAVERFKTGSVECRWTKRLIGSGSK